MNWLAGTGIDAPGGRLAKKTNGTKLGVTAVIRADQGRWIFEGQNGSTEPNWQLEVRVRYLGLPVARQ